MSTALLTDRYELTMLDAAVAEGLADRPAVFEAFSRRLPAGRRLRRRRGAGAPGRPGARRAAGAGGARVRSRASCRPPRSTGSPPTGPPPASPPTPRARPTRPAAPSLTVECSFGAGAAARDPGAVGPQPRLRRRLRRRPDGARRTGRPLLEMGGRRTHEQAAVAAARAAYVAGFSATSNLEAGRRHGVPTVGTSAHAFTLAHRTEAEAFAAQVAAQGVGTTLLVDTYDTEQGIRTAVEVAGPELGAVRLDSGDLHEEVHRARRLLDELGNDRTRIVVTSDLDEHAIASLAHTQADSYGVGTSVVTGSGAPTAGFVYKLVALRFEGDDAFTPVAKRSSGKRSLGGRKTAWRTYDDAGRVADELLLLDGRAAARRRPRAAGPARARGPRRGPGALPRLAGRAARRRPAAERRRPALDRPPARRGDPVTRALLVVDVQVDFCEDGSLPVAGRPAGRRRRRGPAAHPARLRRRRGVAGLARRPGRPLRRRARLRHLLAGALRRRYRRGAAAGAAGRGAVRRRRPQGRARRRLLGVRGHRRGARARGPAARARGRRARRLRRRHRPLRAGQRARRLRRRARRPRAAPALRRRRPRHHRARRWRRWRRPAPLVVR